MSVDERIPIYQELFQSILDCPHGNLEETFRVHKEVLEKNPLFYMKMAAWYMKNGMVRDHKVAFVKTLMEADDPTLRDEGWALIQRLPIHLLAQVVRSTKKTKALRSAVKHKLAEMPYNRLVSEILRSSKDLKSMVVALHIPTTKSSNLNFETIGTELFTKNRPIRRVFAQLRNEEDPDKVAVLLEKLPIPSYIAMTSIKVRTPEIVRVLVKRMTPNELIQSLNMLGRLRAIKPNMDIIRGKLDKLVSDPRVNAMRVLNILQHLEPALVPYEVFEVLERAVSRKAKSISKIDARVSLHIDTSGSMEPAIEIGKMLATSLSIACKEPPTVYSVSSTPFKVQPSSYTPSGWKESFSLLRANGATPLGAGISLMKQHGDTCDVIILVTDTGENSFPKFADEYQTLGNKPRVIILNVSRHPDRGFLGSLRRANVSFEMLQVRRVDQYSVDQVVTLIGESSPFKTIMEIMNTDVPLRPTWTKKPQYWLKK